MFNKMNTKSFLTDDQNSKKAFFIIIISSFPFGDTAPSKWEV